MLAKSLLTMVDTLIVLLNLLSPSHCNFILENDSNMEPWIVDLIAILELKLVRKLNKDRGLMHKTWP
jgi:hypothetical protein